jgi:type II secretory pathway pseudopilin PulG
MAGDKIAKKGMLEAATITEVVIALVIIVVVFGMAMMIFANVTQQAISTKKIRATAVLRNILLKANLSLQLPQEPFNQDGFRIIPVIKPVENEPGLNELYLTAYDENQQEITKIAEIMISKDAKP